MQYMYSMSKGDCKFERLDNDRYTMQWTTVKELLDDFLHNAYHVRYEANRDTDVVVRDCVPYVGTWFRQKSNGWK